MVEFNPDGSIKLGGQASKVKAANDHKMKNTRCVKIKKEVVSTFAPKKCTLRITLSDVFEDGTIVEKVHDFFSRSSETPTKLNRITEKEWEIEVGSSFKRCTECLDIISRFRAYLQDNVIVEKGNCTYTPKVFF